MMAFLAAIAKLIYYGTITLALVLFSGLVLLEAVAWL